MKVECMECAWVGEEADALSIPHPWREDQNLQGCPNCREANAFFEWEEPERPPTVTENIEMLAGEIARMAEVIEIVIREVRARSLDKG